ncbi:MAG: serine hydrolase, partial [Pyrinomonadaceae bacterium]|nr:serine hydrolase [Pyrinomonadaceae bacterium]
MFHKFKKIFLSALFVILLTSHQICLASDLKDLQQKLETISKNFKGKIGISLHHLKTDDRLDLLGNEKFPTGSTIKVAMLCAAMEKIEKGEL